MKRLNSIWIWLVLIGGVWGFYFFWKQNSHQKSLRTPRDIPKERPLTELKIKEKVIKLKSVKAGEIATANYILYNIGKNPLVIDYVNPDCNCTSCEISDSITAPGDSMQITLKFNSEGKAGTNFLNTVMKVNTPTELYKLGFVIHVNE